MQAKGNESRVEIMEHDGEQVDLESSSLYHPYIKHMKHNLVLIQIFNVTHILGGVFVFLIEPLLFTWRIYLCCNCNTSVTQIPVNLFPEVVALDFSGGLDEMKFILAGFKDYIMFVFRDLFFIQRQKGGLMLSS